MSNPAPPAISLEIRNDVAELAHVTHALDRLGKDAAIPEKAVTQLQVALDEVLSNIIKYAWPEGGAHELQVHIETRRDEIEAVITDDGVAFDPRGQPDAPSRGRPSRRGGLGLHMLRQLVDRIEYARIDGRNRVTLIKQYGATSQRDEHR